MKKLLAILMALALCLTCASAFAAEDFASEIKLSNFYFSTDEIPAYGTAPAGAAWDLSKDGDQKTPTGESGDSVTEQDGVFTWTGGKGWLQFNVSGADATGAGYTTDLTQNYKYYAFKVENTKDATVKMGVANTLVSSGGAVSGEVTVNQVRIYNTDGTEAADCKLSVEDIWNNGTTRAYVTVPAKKSCWFVVPITSKNVPNFNTVDAANGNFEIPADKVGNWSAIEAGTPLYIWQFLFTASPDEVTNTADFSVIAYAAVALCGSSALVFAKKKRS